MAGLRGLRPAPALTGERRGCRKRRQIWACGHSRQAWARPACGHGKHVPSRRRVAPREAAAAVSLDCSMVCAALLHDVLEDTDCDPEYLRAEFGDEVTDLVERLTAFRDGAEVPDDD